MDGNETRFGDSTALRLSVDEIRSIAPVDRDACESFLRDLSDDDLTLRFGRPLSRDHPAIVQHLFGPTAPGREFVGAFSTRAVPSLLGTASLCRCSEEGHSEVALVVRQASRSRGVGTELLAHVIRLARSQGVARLNASTLTWNGASLGLMSRAGFRISARGLGDVKLHLHL